MIVPNRRILIIILNWNGWADTKECLDSVLQLKNVDFNCLLVDNGSTDDIQFIEQYALSNFTAVHIYTKEEVRQSEQLPYPDTNSFIIIKNNENLGFAKANNVGIRYAELTGFEYIYLLNNDTVVQKDSLNRLASTLYNAPYAAVVPQIRYYHPNDMIWCCGGELKGFYEHYNFKNERINLLPLKELIPVTFSTGCALLFKRSKLNRLSEKFFFGEEDFELALRLKKEGLTMACVLSAVVYHKESASINRSAKYLNKIYIHKLNRMINIKDYAPLRWPFIIAYRSFKFFLLMKFVEKRKFINAFRYSYRFCEQAFQLKEVNKETFFEILNLDLS